MDLPLIKKATAILHEILPEIVAIRHQLHQYPELSWQEHKTSTLIRQQLAMIPGISAIRQLAEVGVAADLNGAREGRTIALRADMDALPIAEEGTRPYHSVHEGVMHACGHDGHTAILLGAARLLSRLQGELAGSVRFIFQPAEEGGFGAKRLCDEGVLAHPSAVDAIFGLHGWPGVQVGRIGVKAGPLMAADTHFRITVSGKGCHAAMPSNGTDQILIMARIIDALQTVRSRQTQPTEPLTLSVTQVHGGTAINILPSTVVAHGTLRTTEEGTRDRAVAAMEAIVRHTAQAHGAEAALEVTDHYPLTSNDPAATRYLREIAHGVIGKDNTLEVPAPVMGAEDFSYYLQRVPGSFFFLGIETPPPAAPCAGLHHPMFDFNDDAMFTGILLFTMLALSSARFASNT